ncbi:MAG: cysteine hydrolase family protein [Betaproteobacteria bacterium]
MIRPSELYHGGSPALPGTEGCALAVIDMQNAYCDPAGFFASRATDKEACVRVVEPCRLAVEAARRAGVPVIYVVKVSFSEQTPTIGFHNARRDAAGLMLPESRDAAIADALQPRPGEPVVHKLAYSAFHGTAFDAMLQRMGVRQLAVIGVTTSICVESTVRDAAQRGMDVYVARDASAEWEVARHEQSIAQMGYAFARIVTVQQLAEAWAK